MKSRLLCIVLFAACAESRPQARDTAKPEPTFVDVAALASAIEAKRAELRIPGAAVAIVTDTRVVMQQGFGFRDVAQQLPVTSKTLFALGSCTKPFTSLAFAVSVDSHVVSFDDPPRRYLPYFALRDSIANAQVTLRDLLSHRTGVPIDDRRGWYERYPTRERLIRFAMSVPPTRAFRSAFQYNNFMYVAAGEALAAAHHSSFADVLERRVFAPAGMSATTTSLARVAAFPDVSLGYSGGARDSVRNKVPIWLLTYLNGIEAAGAVWSNAEDMSRWLRILVAHGILDGRRIVSDSAFNQLTTPAVSTRGAQYGLGWFIDDWHGATLYTHAGGVTGFGVRCEFAPSLKLGWAVLTNVDNGELPGAVRELVYQRLVRTPK